MGNILSLFELEEMIGWRWHRLIGGASSWPRFPLAGATLAEAKGELAVFFRGLGGAAGITLAGAQAESSRHRLALRQYLGLGEEKITRPRRDGTNLYLPPRLEVFADGTLNRRLYFWLAAFLPTGRPGCPNRTPTRCNKTLFSCAMPIGPRRQLFMPVPALSACTAICARHCALSAPLAGCRATRRRSSKRCSPCWASQVMAARSGR